MTSYEEYLKEQEQIREWVREKIRCHYFFKTFTRDQIMTEVLNEYGVTISEELADEVLDEMCKSKEYICNEDGTYIMNEKMYEKRLIAARKKNEREARKAKKAAHAAAEGPVV